METNFIQRIDINTWILNLDRKTILLDPWLIGDASMMPILKLKNLDGMPMKIKDLPAIDVIVITHKDVDHCHVPTLMQLDKSIQIICPADVAAIVRKIGFNNIVVLNYWDEYTLNNSSITITAVPAEHPKVVKQNAYVFNLNKKAIYFTGDTNFVSAFKDIGDRFNIEYALIPITGVALTFIGQIVMGPNEAITCLELLKSKRIIPTSYGNIALSGLLKPFMNIVGHEDEFKILLQEKLPLVELICPKRLEKILLFNFSLISK